MEKLSKEIMAALLELDNRQSVAVGEKLELAGKKLARDLESDRLLRFGKPQRSGKAE